MAGNFIYVIGLVFLLIFIRIMFQAYDNWYYTSELDYANMTQSLNETLPLTESSFGTSDIWSFITGIKYSSDNIPWWITLLIYTPIIFGIIYLLAPIPFKA